MGFLVAELKLSEVLYSAVTRYEDYLDQMIYKPSSLNQWIS
jgi:hypothetical protein